VFVTSRPEDVLCRTIALLKPSSSAEWSVVHIHGIEKSLDIKVYAKVELTGIAKSHSLEGGWPSSTKLDVVGNANRLFIYASGNPPWRLSELDPTLQVVQGCSSLSTQLIDELHRTTLKRALHEKKGW